MIPNKQEHSRPAIYLFRNRANQRVYVGAAKNVCRRYADYRRFTVSSRQASRGVEYALRKWGLEAFDFEILEWVQDLSQLKEREQYWLDTLTPFDKAGYNWMKISNYGDRGPYAPWVGRSEFARKVYREKVAAIWIDMASKPVYQIDKNTLTIVEEYSSAAEATRALGLPYRTVSNFCLAKRRRTKDGGFYWCYKDEYDAGRFIPPPPQTRKRAVKQIDDQDNIVKVWDSVEEAARAIGTTAPGIRRCCDGGRKHCKGWKWQYVENQWNRKIAKRTSHETPEQKAHRLQRQSIKAAGNATIRPIIQSDRQGNVIRVWDSIRGAAKSLDISFTAIARCCARKRPSAFGFVWMFVEDPMVIEQIKARRKVEEERALASLPPPQVYTSLSGIR